MESKAQYPARDPHSNFPFFAGSIPARWAEQLVSTAAALFLRQNLIAFLSSLCFSYGGQILFSSYMKYLRSTHHNTIQWSTTKNGCLNRPLF